MTGTADVKTGTPESRSFGPSTSLSPGSCIYENGSGNNNSSLKTPQGYWTITREYL